MKILVIGGGGREHAIIWKLKQIAGREIYAAPGNAGLKNLAENVPIDACDAEKLAEFAINKGIDYTIVGPDDPLGQGVVDYFESKGLKIFGPKKYAAQLECSKSFSKGLMKKYGIPTAEYAVFDDYIEACAYTKGQKLPIVLKADGLALGKGVLICNTYDEAEAGLKEILLDKKFGDSGNTVVIEEYLTGNEVSVLAFCDGKTVKPMVSAQDHKRAYDGDKGPNTGGMGTISPSRHYTADIAAECEKKIICPTINMLITERIEYKGVIFFQFMLTNEGPKVIEYNARFGDPETQVVLTRLKTDLLEIIIACIEGRLNEIEIKWYDNAAACVMLASGGYPGDYEKGFEIFGLDHAVSEINGCIFHSGTKFTEGKVVTNGGRVLGVTCTGKDLSSALEESYKNAILESGMQASVVRNEVIQNNIANVDTPGFKRSSVDFESILTDALEITKSGGKLDLSRVKPVIVKEYANFSYRLDDNNVDIETEMVDLYQNSVKYDVMAESVMNNYKRINMVITAR
ncbi:phosphoribosylamine--glycine ligase [Holotrichia oblita]|nr:phosphoribosylamine--glycine ligase [Holotrichia oblita]